MAFEYAKAVLYAYPHLAALAEAVGQSAENQAMLSFRSMESTLALAEKIAAEVEMQLRALPREQIARASIEKSGGIIVVGSLGRACELANEIAPEHLELYVEDPAALLPKIRNAGAVFLGGYTPEPVGDYFAGPDHILPTSGSAKFFQVLNEDIFTRKMSVISYTKEALFADGADIIRLADSEGLGAHANAVAIRMKEREERK